MKVRRRAVMKWAGALLSGLLVIVYVASARWHFGFANVTDLDMRAYPGQITVDVHSSRPPRTDVIEFWKAARGPRWNWYRAYAEPGGGPWVWWFWIRTYRGSCDFGIPLWFPLLLVAIPTGYLWHTDRARLVPGRCPRCGYDLSGLPSGRGGVLCPECGGGKAAHPANQQSSK